MPSYEREWVSHFCRDLVSRPRVGVGTLSKKLVFRSNIRAILLKLIPHFLIQFVLKWFRFTLLTLEMVDSKTKDVFLFFRTISLNNCLSRLFRFSMRNTFVTMIPKKAAMA